MQISQNNYKAKEVNFADSSPSACYLCPNLIYGIGVKLHIYRSYVLPFHKACYKKVEKSLDEGFSFVRKIPLIVRAKKTDKDTEITTRSGEKITVKAGEYMMIGIEGEKYPCAAEIFEKTFEVFPRE